MVSGIGTLSFIGIYIVGLFILTLFLFWISKILKFERKTFAPAFLVAAIFTAISLIFYIIKAIIGIIPETNLILIPIEWLILIFVLIFSIKIFYKVKWGQALICFLILFGLYIVIIMLVMIIIFALFNEQILQLFEKMSSDWVLLLVS